MDMVFNALCAFYTKVQIYNKFTSYSIDFQSLAVVGMRNQEKGERCGIGEELVIQNKIR